MVAFLVVITALLFARAAAQSIRTVNGSIHLEIPGATLALTGTSGSTSVGSSGNIATTNDLNAAIQTSLSQTQPQINNVNTAVQNTNTRVDGVQSSVLSLALNISAETVRAVLAEGALNAQILQEQARATSALNNETTRALLAEGVLATQIQQEQTRATNAVNNETTRALLAESALNTLILQEQIRATTAVNNETTRAVAAETSLALRASNIEASAAQLATTLAQTQSTLQQTQTSLQQTQSTLVQTQASLANSQNTNTQSLTNMLARLAAITNCTALGLFPDGNGSCIRATTNPSTTCSANASTLPRCQPGYYPVSTAASACASDTPFPTTFTCQAAPCPPNSGGLNVPAGCFCNAGYSGTVTTSSVYPYFVSTCTAVTCPPFTTGSTLVNGCSCNNLLGFYGTGTLPVLTAPQFFTNICQQFTSCREIQTQLLVPAVGRTSGIYYLNYSATIGVLPVFCDQVTNGGGWELNIKIASNAGNLFSYRSTLWTSGAAFGTTSLDETDTSALFPQYNNVLYNQVLVKFRSGSSNFAWPATSINPAVTNPAPNSLKNFFNYAGGYSFVSGTNGIGLTATSNNPFGSLSYWAASATTGTSSGNFFSIADPCATGCGFGYHDFALNTCCGTACVRWGYIQNNEPDCNSNDMAAGFGLGPGTPGGALVGGETSAGDFFACCGRSGAQTSMYVSVWGRRS